jgi:hypothetical protein
MISVGVGRGVAVGTVVGIEVAVGWRVRVGTFVFVLVGFAPVSDGVEVYVFAGK